MPQENNINLSIVIPVFNEDKYISKLFDDIEKHFNEKNIEVLVVDDGSTDDTAHILTNIKKKNYLFDYKLISIEKNTGKGNAVSEGIKKSNGKYVLLQDADLELSLIHI